jgi:hypothetical protein
MKPLACAWSVAASALVVVLSSGCGSPAHVYSLDVGGGDDGGNLALSPRSDAGGPGTLDAHVEQNHMAVSIVTLTCANGCADVVAVASGGNPPYSFAWDDGATGAARHVCPTSSRSYSVTVTDTGTSGELARAAQSTQASVTASVIACPDGGGPGDAGGGVDAGPGAKLASVTVPGTADVWLAGQPSGASIADTTYGSTASDVAPANSPVEVPVAAGSTLTFSATGATSYTGGFCSAPPDGGCIITVSSGPLNGISGVQAPGDALLGVFTGAGAPGGTSPAALNFGGGNITFATLSPLLDQVFFIGDGLTGNGSGTAQDFVVPAGASRLFLATADGAGAAYNNSGQLDVVVYAR